MNPQNLNILIVEDDPDFLSILANEYLTSREAGVNILFRHASSMESAFEKISEEKPDAILLDLNLPDSKGTGTIRKMVGNWPEIPVVVITGSDVSGKEALECGAQDFLSKKDLLKYDGPLLIRIIQYSVARKELVEKEHRSQLLVLEAMNNAPVSIVIRRISDMSLVFVNAEFLRTTGYSLEDMMDMQPSAIIEQQPGEPSFLEILRSELKNSGEMRNRPISIRFKSGEVHNYIAQGSSVNFGGDECIVVVANDITAQQKFEEQLRKSESHLVDAQRVANLGSWEWDIRTNQVTWSRQLYQMLDYDPHLVPANFENFLKRVHPEDVEKIKGSLQNTLENHKPYCFEYRILLPDGSEATIYEDGKLEFNKNGDPTRIIGAALDITEKKKAEADLEKERNFNSLILETMGNILGVIDQEGNVVRFNRAGEIISGFSAGQVIGKKFWEVLVPPETREAMQEEFPNLLKMSGQHKVEGPWEDSFGKKHIISWTFATLRNGDGDPEFVITSGMDVTEQRELEISLMKAFLEGQENESERMAEDLHDGIGPLLSTAQINLEGVDLSGISPKMQEKILNAKILLGRASREIREISHNLMPSALEDFGLKNVLEDLCAKVQAGSRAEISFSSSGNLMGIPRDISLSLYRITQELLANAQKHAEAREISIQLIRRDPVLVLMVEDDGKGFDPKYSNANGLGIRNISTRVRALKGSIFIDSSPGKGSEITIEIPLSH